MSKKKTNQVTPKEEVINNLEIQDSAKETSFVNEEDTTDKLTYEEDKQEPEDRTFTEEDAKLSRDLEDASLEDLEIWRAATDHLSDEEYNKMLAEHGDDDDEEVMEGLADFDIINNEVNEAATILGVKRVFKDSKDPITDLIEDQAELMEAAEYEDLLNEFEQVNVLKDYSTLLEFYQAKSCVEGFDLDFIPFDYVDFDEENNLIKGINFSFMLSFKTIKNDVDYITLKEDHVILNEGIFGIPSRYDLIQHEMTLEANFNVEGKYDVKSIFNPEFTVLQSSLSNNVEVVK